VRAAAPLALLSLAIALGGCSDGAPTAAAERGRQIYFAYCTACHNVDPSQPGPIGPPIKGSSRELLEAKVLNGSYPPGYTPKRPTKVMVPMPAVAPEIPALAEYLR
jgi:mono/diheme cytochrome c family protein